MISEWMLGTLLDLAKNGVIAGINKINQEDFDSVLNKTLIEFEHKYFGFPGRILRNLLILRSFKLILNNI
jgi:hypothetical protein